MLLNRYSYAPARKKLLNELKPGAIVISYVFTFPNWKSEKIILNPNNPKENKMGEVPEWFKVPFSPHHAMWRPVE